MVHASAQAPRQPDFLLEDAEGGWGLEVTEAGSKPHQQRMTEMAREPGEPYLVSDDGWSPASIVSQLRTAIKSKVCKFDGGWYGPRCELAVFNNTEDVLSDEIVAAVDNGSLSGRFEAVHLVDSDGKRVYADILSDAPKRIGIAADYDVDFADWIADQVELLRASQWSRLDVDNLIEEVAALARRDDRELESRLKVLFAHLLKWEYQPRARSGSWVGTINSNCDELAGILRDSPSRRRHFDPDGRVVERAYGRALRDALDETGLSRGDFPTDCPFRAQLEAVCRGQGDPEDSLAGLRRRPSAGG